jgi:L-lactate dehydrogenase
MDTLGLTAETIKDAVADVNTLNLGGIYYFQPSRRLAHYIQTRLNHPPRKILPAGAALDSARLRRVLAETVGIDRKSIHACRGGHGASRMALWSAALAAGKPMRRPTAEKPEP